MNLEPLISLRISGVIIFLSVVLPMLIIIVISRGDFSGFQASMRGVEGVGESANILRKMLPIAPLTLVLTLIGFGMLTLLLRETGDKGISQLAFILLIFSQVFIISRGPSMVQLQFGVRMSLPTQVLCPNFFSLCGGGCIARSNRFMYTRDFLHW